MTDNLILQDDFSWDAPTVTEAEGGRKHFATLRFYPVRVTPFQSGKSFTIPGVYDDKFDEGSKLTVRQGLKEFRGMVQGGKHVLYVLVAEQSDKANNAYQLVKQFKSWPEKGRKNIWADYQFPALAELDAASRAKIQKGETIFVEFEDAGSGDMVDIRGTQQEVKYWSKFVAYPDAAALKAAEVAFFAQFAGANGVSLDNVPETWFDADPKKLVANRASLIDMISKEAGKPYLATAEMLSLVQNGKPVNRAGTSEPIDLLALFKEALPGDAELNVPAPMSPFAALYK